MQLHQLAPAPGAKRPRRRVGRGHGSGRGKTAGKGTKGQNARAGGGVKPFFEGGQNPWTMRIPHKRGFSRRRFRVEPQVVNLRDLERVFAAGDIVTPELLVARGLADDASGRRPIKLLGDGTLSKALSVQVHAASASAREAVEKAGGTLLLPAAAQPSPPSTQPAETGASAVTTTSAASAPTTAGEREED